MMFSFMCILSLWTNLMFRLAGFLFLLTRRMHISPPQPSTTFGHISNPRHQMSLWSDVDLGHRIEWGLGFRYVDHLPAQKVSSYTELDTRLAWKPTAQCEVSVIGRNLLNSHH